MSDKKKYQNEQKFKNWKPIDAGGRMYWYSVRGRHGWTARYVKEVDKDENTLRFFQEIYNKKGTLVEIHKKYPVDKGHKKL